MSPSGLSPRPVPAAALPSTVIVTGHFPPEPGGVQTFTWEIVRRLPADRLVVVAPSWPGDRAFDAGLPFPVVRRHGYALFRGLRGLVRARGATAAWITAMAPFGMYAPLVRAAGPEWLVGSTHGQELGWVRALPTRLALRGAARQVDVLTYLSPTTQAVLQRAGLRPRRSARLAGGVDLSRFGPQAGGAAVRSRYGFGDDPVVISVSRLVRRKGYDTLLTAWPSVRRRHPDARLLIVGEGPLQRPLAERARREFGGSVVVTGRVPAEELAGHFAAANVFVLACRDDRHGLQTEGLGLSTLEASASGLPVVVGRSGGSASSVVDGVTGWLVDAAGPAGPAAVAAALDRLLCDPEAGHRMGEAGRSWVGRTYTWEGAAGRLAGLLSGATAAVGGPR